MDRAWLKHEWDKRATDVEQELENLGPEPAATALQGCHEALRRRFQLEILRDELDDVRKAALADVNANTARDTPGARWAAGPSGPLAARQALEAGIQGLQGRYGETLAGEAGVGRTPRASRPRCSASRAPCWVAR